MRIVDFIKETISAVKLKFKIVFMLNDYLYYINGPEKLLPPLNKEEEKVVFAGLENGDAKCRDILIVHNLRLVVYIAKKFESNSTNLEDIISIGTIGLIKAVNTFVPSKNIKLATYATRCIENEILMHLRKTQNKKLETSIDEALNIDTDGNELLLSDVLVLDDSEISDELLEKEEHSILNKAVSALPEKERVIIEMRFGLCGKTEKTQKEVADILGISQSYISRLDKKIIKRLKDEIELLV